MKIKIKTAYKTKNEKDYKQLLQQLENEGYRWSSGNIPTDKAVTPAWDEELQVFVNSDRTIQYGYSHHRGYSIEVYEPERVMRVGNNCFCVDADSYEEAKKLLEEYWNTSAFRLRKEDNDWDYKIKRDGNKTIVTTPDAKEWLARCNPEDTFDIVEGFRVALGKQKRESDVYKEEQRALSTLKTFGCKNFDLCKGSTWQTIYGYKDYDEDDEHVISISINPDCFKDFDEYEQYHVDDYLEE